MAKPKNQDAPPQRTDKAPSMAVRKACFLSQLRRSANVSRAAREAGLAHSTAYRQRARSKTFAAEWDDAIAEALDTLEEAILARVRDGVPKPVFYGGEQIGTVHQYSDPLAMFVLKSKRPEIYNREPHAFTQADDLTEVEAMAEFDRRMARLKED